MNKKAKFLILALVVIAIGIQFIPVERTNPPVTGEIQVPADVAAAIETSCYDCHSNETKWPWYSRIAPASWFLARHVRHGRSDLNFSTWSSLDAREKADMAHEIYEEVEEGEMPLSSYLRVHRDAVPTEAGRQALLNWARAASGGTVD